MCSLSWTIRPEITYHIQVKPPLISYNLKACFGYRRIIMDSIKGNLVSKHLTSIEKAICLAMPCHHYTVCIHSYGAYSTPLYKMAIDLTRRLICHLIGLVFNPLFSPEKLDGGTTSVVDDLIIWQLVVSYMVPSAFIV